MSALPETLEDWICRIATLAIRDLPAQNVHEFAAEHIFLGGNSSLLKRFYDPALTPYTKLFQEAATNQFSYVPLEDWWLRNLMESGQRVDEFFALKSSQSGFTQAAINIIVYLTKFLSGRGLYCIDSRDKAGKLCKLRLLPLLKEICASQVSDNEDDLGTYWIEMAEWVWEMVGSYSAGVFSEKALSHAFLDDVEYMVTEGGKRGMLDGVHIIDHCRSRFTTADEHFLAVFSKPDIEKSIFVENCKGGSQHRYFVPCPYCNGIQFLKRKSLRYDKRECKDLIGTYDLDAVERYTTVRCEHCGKDIEESWKPRMVGEGYYLPKSREDRVRDRDPLLVPRRLSVHVNDMISPFAEVKWGRIARQLIEAENNPEKLKFVITNHFAEPWQEKAISLKADQVKALIAGKKDVYGRVHGEAAGIGAYNRGECPFIPVAITATADRQLDKKKWTLCAWKLDGSCALLEYGATLSEEALHDLNSYPTAHHGGPIVCLLNPELQMFAGYGIDSGGCLIDSGYETFEVYDFCDTSGWRWYPSKGVGGLTGAGYLVEGKQDFKDGRGILRYNYNDYAIKVAFYKGKIALHSHPKADVRKPSNLYLPRDVGDDFIIELLSESLQPVKSKIAGSTSRMEWVHDTSVGPNDWGDAMKMQYVLWQIIGPLLQQAHAQKALTSGNG